MDVCMIPSLCCTVAVAVPPATVEWYRSDHLVQIHVRVHGMAHDRENLVLVPNCAVCVGGCM